LIKPVKLAKWGVVVLTLIAAFLLGQFLSGPPRFKPAPPAAGSELDRAWENFQKAQNDALTLARSQPFYGHDEQSGAEGTRSVLFTLVGALQVSAFIDPDFPHFVTMPDITSKSGMENPDNIYKMTIIRDDRDYLIRGTRGTTQGLVFQLLLGRPGVGSSGSSTNIDMLSGADLLLGEDGAYEIILSRNDPGPGKNWLKVDDGAETVLLRQTFSEWNTEQAGELSIEPLCADCPAAPSPLTEAQLARQINRASEALHDRMASWLKYSDLTWTVALENGLRKLSPTRGGLVGQFSALGRFDLAEDEALIISARAEETGYQGVQLANRWFTSLDYRTRQSSLNRSQAHITADGLIHYVISARDPGVQNWLDTEDHRQGLIMMRWQGLKEKPDFEPAAKKVKLADILDHLPADMRRVSEAERKAVLAARRRAVDVR